MDWLKNVPSAFHKYHALEHFFYFDRFWNFRYSQNWRTVKRFHRLNSRVSFRIKRCVKKMDTLAKGLFLLQEKFAPVKNWEHCHLDLFCKLMSQEVFLWYKVSKVVVTLKRDRQNSSPKCHFWKGLYLNSYCLAGMLSFYKSKGLLFLVGVV